MKKALVIIPTYNERDTLPLVIDGVLKHDGFHGLVVGDCSADGAAAGVKEIMPNDDRMFLVERPGKLGLGSARSPAVAAS